MKVKVDISLKIARSKWLIKVYNMQLLGFLMVYFTISIFEKYALQILIQWDKIS